MATRKDGNDGIRKKLAADGGSQPAKVEIIQIYRDFNSKFEYFVKLLHTRYEVNPSFYIQRHELNWLRDIIWKDSVWCVNAPVFDYNGTKISTDVFNLETKHQEMIRLNKIFVFHNITRDAMGDINITGRYL